MSLSFWNRKKTANEIDLSEFERDSRYRIFDGAAKTALTVVLTIFALFQLYASLSGRLP